MTDLVLLQSDAVRGTLQRVGCTDYLLPPELPAEAADLIKQLLQKVTPSNLARLFPSCSLVCRLYQKTAFNKLIRKGRVEVPLS
jgi:hypothetical protein